MIVMIDNYDSFTYNIFQQLAERGVELKVIRNDQITLEGLDALSPTHLIVSPGPGNPDEAGISMDAIKHFAGKIPVLGVCLGHQSLAQVFGGKVIRAERLMHGKTSPIHHNGKTIFHAMPQPFEATRYHSLIVERQSLPDTFEITAETSEGEIMGLRHRPTGAEGVQFHPESILTNRGAYLLENFAKC
ncbi:MAG: aminodeoxychorismate/anthranilate synthase component II [Myxococcota bacterium]|nr:aminodeoxychorismate/anthranilate synthase component II [Myxococcota bacterium]